MKLSSVTKDNTTKAIATKIHDRFCKERNPYGQTSIKLGDAEIFDELDDVREIVKHLRRLNSNANYSISRRGRGPRVHHESYANEYQCYLPLDKAAYVAVYIVERKKVEKNSFFS